MISRNLVRYLVVVNWSALEIKSSIDAALVLLLVSMCLIIASMEAHTPVTLRLNAFMPSQSLQRGEES